MKAVGPPDGLTAYLERLGEPAVIVSTENRQPLGTLQDQQCVWRSKAAIESAILCKSDIQALNNLVEEIVSGPSLSKQAGGWEGTRLDSSHIVLRRIQSFEPDDHATLVDNLEQNLVLGHEGFPDVPKSEPAVDQHPRVNVFVELAEHDEVAQSVLNYNWAATTLGPMEQWDPCVESAVYSLLVYPWPACICLGEQHHLIYNKAYSYILGSKHPSAMGLRVQDVWPEIWEYIGPYCRQVMQKGISIAQEDSQLFLETAGDGRKHTEMRVMWAYIPFLNSQNNPAGFYNVVIDRTKMHIEERRSQTLRALRANIGAARDQNAVYGKAIEILKDYRQDVPFIAIYSVEDAAQAGHTGSVCLKLRESLGIIKETAIPKECQVLLAPTSDSPKTIGHWPFARALKEDLVSVNLPSHLKSRDVFDNPGWPEDVVQSAAVACSSQSHGLPRVLTVIGFNTRHPIDEDSRQFALSVSRFIDTGIMAALDAENERSHLQTMERVIRMRTEELANSQARFKSLCDFSPSGVLECSPEGQITYVNDAWKRMTTISSPVPLPYDCFIPSIINASAADIRSQWEQALKLRQSVRMQWQWKHGGSVYSETFPLPSGQVMSVWTDISAHLSYSDKLVDRQRARAEEAEAAQKVQENFISLIQHETRNPVNAILQGTDVVFSCLQNLENLHQSMLNATNKQGLSVEESRQELVYISGLAASSASDIKEVHETVGAIAIAARHQAKIAADLLSQSKMQQGLLTLSPFDFVLLKEVDKILKLFAAQARLAQVSTEIQHDDSINELTVVRADPTRFTQIIVNLVSNSMRFLEMWEGERSLIISLSLCRDRPLLQTTAVDMKSNADSKRTPSDLGENKIFLLCRVRDSGPGLTAEQQSRLFTRFNDVSQNLEQNRLRGGGTGLGLYLSRQLASLQGGEIAADSSEGQGSTFSFYIEVEMGRRDRLEAEQDVHNLDEKKSLMPPVSPQPWPPVLVVEDNSISQKLMRRQLENRGFRVKTACNGFDALKIMCSDEVLLAGLLDVEMPVKDGIQTSKELRAFEKQVQRKRSLPLCAVTGNASDSQVNKIKSAGADLVLSKPYQIGDLVQFLHEAGRTVSNGDL